MKKILISGSILLAVAACGKASDEAPTTENSETTTQAAAPEEKMALTGEEIFKRCMACHKVDKDAPNGIGPNLHGVVGRKVASLSGFDYSKAMMSKDGVWDEDSLNEFLEHPMKTVPGTKMGFAGISNEEERETLIEFLETQK